MKKRLGFFIFGLLLCGVLLTPIAVNAAATTKYYGGFYIVYDCTCSSTSADSYTEGAAAPYKNNVYLRTYRGSEATRTLAVNGDNGNRAYLKFAGQWGLTMAESKHAILKPDGSFLDSIGYLLKYAWS